MQGCLLDADVLADHLGCYTGLTQSQRKRVGQRQLPQRLLAFIGFIGHLTSVYQRSPRGPSKRLLEIVESGQDLYYSRRLLVGMRFVSRQQRGELVAAAGAGLGHRAVDVALDRARRQREALSDGGAGQPFA